MRIIDSEIRKTKIIQINEESLEKLQQSGLAGVHFHQVYPLPEKIKNAAEMYAGCVASAIQKDEYLEIIKNCGFQNVTIQKEKPIIIPNDILKNYLNEEEIEIIISKLKLAYDTIIK